MLGKTMPQRTATYAEAFFPLGIGFERASKIILQVDRRLVSGEFIAQKEMRALGHNLVRLFDVVEQVCERRYPGDSRFSRPVDTVHVHIVGILGEFAGGGRYFHLDYLGGANSSGGDAAAQWWDVVVAEVSKRHYTKARRDRDRERAGIIGSAFDGVAIVRDSLVNGADLDSIEKAVAVSSENDATIPWCRMYTLQIARWLVRILIELGYDGAGNPDIPYFAEFFRSLNQEDVTLRSRKTWMMSHH
ncbi:hypothetical protein ACFYUC_08995 [Streptomyces coelicoflavus]|uniref:hypothetical protein n=1 Tax=Streptomyces coelicoflavus TaxID=285562 RepID=UPI00368E88AA